MLRTVKFPASRVHHTALLEDEESIQASLMEVVNALLRGTIELKRAELILRALNTAVRNIRRVKFSIHSDDMVREIPDYPTPPLEQVDEQYANELHRQEQRAARAKKEDPLIEYFGGADKIPANLRKPSSATAPPASAAGKSSAEGLCGDGSQTRPGGPEVPGRSAVPQKPVQAEAATRKPPVGVKAVPASPKTQAAMARAQAPKEREQAARGPSASLRANASRG
jgi:hypothetical protein